MNEATAYQLPEQLSTFAPEYDWLYNFVFEASAILFVVVIALTVWFCFRYHKSRHPVAAPTGSHVAVELIWTFSPLIILVLLFHWGFQSYVKGAIAPDDSIEIRVRGKQWLWEFEYPNGYKEIGILKVPVHQAVKLIMSSDDVLHSFYVPGFRWKKDVVPGQYSTMWFNATKLGETQVYCAEYCGTSHSGMLAKIQVVEQAVYDKFLKEGGGAPEGATPAEWGKMLYTQNNCNTCHSVDGSALVGPSWKGIWGRAEGFADGGNVSVDENYVRESILTPMAHIVKGYKPVMPVYSLNDKQIDAIIAYMKTLK